MNRRTGGWTKGQRIRFKLFVTALGLLLIAILLWVGSRREPIHNEIATEEPEAGIPTPVPAPVVETLKNVWIAEEDESGILVFAEGVKTRYEYGRIKEQSNPELGAAVIGYRPEESVREQVADVVLTDKAVTEIRVKSDKVSGKLLGCSGGCLELEGCGRLPIAEDCKGYRVYNALVECDTQELPYGYDFVDLVLEEGEVCAFLWAREEAMDNIRVLLQTSNYGGRFHESVLLVCDASARICWEENGNPAYLEWPAGTELAADAEGLYLDGRLLGERDSWPGRRVRLEPEVNTAHITLTNVSRGQGKPSYRGAMELLNGEEGLVLINEVPLEEYLYSVVPSEMPASYPEEALKAQAVCARTYAYGYLTRAAFPEYGAHVDDSTFYQVYNNILEQERTTAAVKETYGQLLYTEEGELAETYYYSTSCGMGGDGTVWRKGQEGVYPYLTAQSIDRDSAGKLREAASGQGAEAQEANSQGTDAQEADSQGSEAQGADSQGTEDDTLAALLQNEDAFRAYITSVNPDDFEAGEGWYRWSYEVGELSPELIRSRLQERYEANPEQILTLRGGSYTSAPVEDFDKISEILVLSRGPGGFVDELLLETDQGIYKVISEYNIRYVLCDTRSRVSRQNGGTAAAGTLLPSAFFVLDTVQKDGNVIGYKLTGGGFGHGVGMSQNGARHMAGEGYDWEEILQFFYRGCRAQCVFAAE